MRTPFRVSFGKADDHSSSSASSSSLPNTAGSSYTVFTLLPDNPCNTEIRCNGKVVYTVDTSTTEANTLTIVRSSFGNVLATLEWKELLSDRVTFGTGNPMSLMSWLKKSLVPFSSTVSFKDDKGRKYKWDGYAAGLQLELYAEDSPTKTPIARFQRSRRNDEAPAMLLLTERAMEIKDTVIISWLFLEKSRRMMDAAANMMSDNSQP